MPAKLATRTNLPTINITTTSDQLTANQRKNSSMYNDSSIIKSGILELCHLIHHHSENGNTIKELVGEQVLVTIYRTCGEYFAVINLLNEAAQLSNSSISTMSELNSNSICVNLKHCKVEKCNNHSFFKLVLNDFTSVILFRVVKRKEQQTHLQAPSINNQQSKSLGDLSVINEIDENENQKNIQNDQTLSWIKAFSYYSDDHQEADLHLLRANSLTPLSRRQSLQTVIESDEEEEEQHYHSIH